MIRLFHVYYPARTLVLLACEAVILCGSFPLAMGRAFGARLLPGAQLRERLVQDPGSRCDRHVLLLHPGSVCPAAPRIPKERCIFGYCWSWDSFSLILAAVVPLLSDVRARQQHLPAGASHPHRCHVGLAINVQLGDQPPILQRTGVHPRGWRERQVPGGENP